MIGTAHLKVRPIKLAFLVEPSNANHVRQAIRLASGLWGGTFFPIIPLNSRAAQSWRQDPLPMPTAKEVVTGYIQKFDPDILVQFCDSLPSYIHELRLQIVKPTEIWNNLDVDGLAEPRYGLCVLDVLEGVYNEYFKYKAKYAPKIVVSSIPKKLGLLWASIYGEYDHCLLEQIRSIFSEPLEIENLLATTASFASLVEQNLLFPRRITGWGLQPSWGSSPPHDESCVLFMDANSVDDIVDYWNLRATGRSVIPFVKEFMKEESAFSAVESFLRSARKPFLHDSTRFRTAAVVRSRGSSMEQVGQFLTGLGKRFVSAEAPEAQFFYSQNWLPRIWENRARVKDSEVADVYSGEEESINIDRTPDRAIKIKPILPNFARKDWYRRGIICANELDFRVYGSNEYLAQVYPRSSGKNFDRAISNIAGFRDEWRVGRHGLVKMVRQSASDSLSIPVSERVFFAWLADHGWTAELSPPGLLAKQIYKQLDGNVGVMTNESVLTLLEHINGGSVGRDGKPAKRSSLSTERQMSVGEVRDRLRRPHGNSGLYDLLLRNGVFRLGLEAKCPHCLRKSWFALPALMDAVDCPKCLGSFPAAGNIDKSKSSWSYRTAGPFSIPNYAEGAYAVLLSLHALGERLSLSFRATAVPSFTATSSGKGQIEADFAMFWREIFGGDETSGLLFGECKTYGLFESRDIERMRHLGNAFPGAVLVFATLRSALTPKEIRSLASLSKAGKRQRQAGRPYNPVLILTAAELLTWKRPPECWPEEQRKRFQHAYDILSLCDATQQIYLESSERE